HTGKIWMRVPETIRVTVEGELPQGVSAKDLTLAIVGRIGLAGGTYHAIEFDGPAVESLTLSSRMTLANMAIEMGAKAGIVHPSGLQWPDADLESLYPDPDATYLRTLTVDASELRPQVSRPHLPDRVTPIDTVVGTEVQMAFIGTCVNGRLEDLHAAAEVLSGQRVAPSVRLMVAPASREVFLQAMEDGTAQILTRAGATFLPSGCGPCVGTHNGVPGPQETVISTGNRNFKGRMGNPQSSVYLASPATVAASAIAGRIVPAQISGGA
ncbi:MAG: aconitase family protein, partial [Myxococcota bacterium]|nr:aconitase family protein [Myxococcota bacterium]